MAAALGADGPVAAADVVLPAAAIPLGAVTRRHLARVLEQQQAALLLAVVETSGGAPEGQWRLVIERAYLTPAPPSPEPGSG